MSFELNPDGTVTQRPVVGWEVDTLVGVQVVLQIGYLSVPEQPIDAPRWAQFCLTPSQAHTLARQLEEVAKSIETPIPGNPAH
jgi:hypothetical protein